MTFTRKRFLLSLFLMLVFCFLGVAYVVTFQADLLQRLAKNLMAGSFGEQITIQQIRVKIFPRPQLELTDVSINGPGHGQQIFQASDIRLGLAFFSTGHDARMPNTMVVENARLDLTRDENGQWNYQNIFQEESSHEVGALLSGYSLELVNGSITIEDRYHRDVPLRVHAEEVELQVERLVMDGPTEFFLSARLSDQDTGSMVSSYGTIEHIGEFLNVESTEPLNTSPQLTVYVRVELDRKTILQTADFFGVDEIPVGLQGRTNAQGHIRFAPGVQGYDLIASDLVVLTDMIDLNAEVSVAGLLHHEPPTLSSRWTSTPLAIRHLPHLIPRDWLPSGLYHDIHREAIRGKIQAVSATVSGSSRKGLGYSLAGKFHVSEGTLTFGREWGKAEEIAGVIHIQSEKVRLSDFQGMYNQIPVTTGTGTIVFRDEGPWLTTELMGDVSAQQALGIVKTAFDLNASHYPIQALHGQTGHGSMTVRFAGPLQNPEKIKFQNAEYHPERVTLRLPGSRRLITQMSGGIAFSPSRLSFENVTGLYGQSDFRIEGDMKFGKHPSMNMVRIQGSVHGHDLLTLFSDQAVSDQKMISGTADYVVMVAGNSEAPTIRGGVDLKGLGIRVPGIIDKHPALAGHLHFNVQIGKNRQLSFEQVALTFPSVRLAGQGHIRYGRTLTLDTSLTTEPINFASLPSGLELFDEMFSAGTLEISLRLLGKGKHWQSWSKSGWVALTNGIVNIEGVTAPVSHVLFRAKLNGHTAEIKRLQWQVEESQVQATGIVQQWDSHPKITATITSPQFDIARLIPEGQRSPLREIFEKVAQTARVAGDLRFDRAWYKELHFQTLTGLLRIQDGVIGVDRIQGKTETGTVQGRLLVHLPMRRPATMKTWFDVYHIPLLALEQTFLNTDALDERLLTGMVSMQGSLEGHGKDARGVFPTLNGTLQLSIEDGHIKRGTVVPKILTILNLPSVLQGQVDLQKDGYPFDRQTGTVTVTHGLLASKDIVMNGPILKMTAAGQYDLVSDELDMVIAASPFGPYMDLLRRIPLFEMLLDSDDEEGVTTALFQIKGSVHAPEVKPLPLESFASGLTNFAKLAFTVLKNTVTLPAKIFFPEQSNEQSVPQTVDSNDDGEEF